jgi:hypothetical protein
MPYVTCTWADIEPDLTAENAKKYARETDRLVFCADLTGLSVDSRLLDRFESRLYALAQDLGYITQSGEMRV